MGRVKDIVLSEDRPIMGAALMCLIELRNYCHARPIEDEELFWAMIQSADITIEQLEERLGIGKKVRGGEVEDDGPAIRGLVEILGGRTPLVDG